MMMLTFTDLILIGGACVWTLDPWTWLAGSWGLTLPIDSL